VRKFIGALFLIRIHNCLLAGVAVWVGAHLCNNMFHNPSIYLSAIAIALICGAGNAFNDYCDVEIDRINHPSRPLPTGLLPPYAAIVVSIILNFMAIILAALSGIRILIPVVIYILALILYNLNLKKIVFCGNLLIAILGGGAFMIGGLATCPDNLWTLPGPLVPAIFAFLFHLGREILKDIADYKGDRALGYRILPEIMPPRWILSISTAIYAILVSLTIVSITAGWFHYQYAMIILFLVDLPLIVLFGYLWVSHSIGKYGLASRRLKYLMIPGLLAFILI